MQDILDAWMNANQFGGANRGLGLVWVLDTAFQRMRPGLYSFTATLRGHAFPGRDENGCSRVAGTIDLDARVVELTKKEPILCSPLFR